MSKERNEMSMIKEICEYDGLDLHLLCDRLKMGCKASSNTNSVQQGNSFTVEKDDRIPFLTLFS